MLVIRRGGSFGEVTLARLTELLTGGGTRRQRQAARDAWAPIADQMLTAIYRVTRPDPAWPAVHVHCARCGRRLRVYRRSGAGTWFGGRPDPAWSHGPVPWEALPDRWRATHRPFRPDRELLVCHRDCGRQVLLDRLQARCDEAALSTPRPRLDI